MDKEQRGPPANLKTETTKLKGSEQIGSMVQGF